MHLIRDNCQKELFTEINKSIHRDGINQDDYKGILTIWSNEDNFAISYNHCNWLLGLQFEWTLLKYLYPPENITYDKNFFRKLFGSTFVVFLLKKKSHRLGWLIELFTFCFGIVENAQASEKRIQARKWVKKMTSWKRGFLLVLDLELEQEEQRIIELFCLKKLFVAKSNLKQNNFHFIIKFCKNYLLPER